MRIWVIVTGWNCEGYVRKCIASVLSQDYYDFRLVVINDGSTDNTKMAIQSMSDPRMLSFNFHSNRGAAFRRWKIMNDPFIQPDDIIVLLGLDDELLPGALTRIALEYLKKKWMTYGNWRNQLGVGLPKDFQLDFPREIHESRDYRKVQYRSTAPNSFYKKLISKLTPEDLQVNGQWVHSCTETNIMFCCLEMCGQSRIGIIREHIYLYNQRRATGTIARFGQAKQDILANFQNRTKKPLYEDI